MSGSVSGLQSNLEDLSHLVHSDNYIINEGTGECVCMIKYHQHTPGGITSEH